MPRRYEPFDSFTFGDVPQSPGGSAHFLRSDTQWAALSDVAAPVGAIVTFPFSAAPAGWLKANGALVSRTTYAALFAAASVDGLISEAAWTAGQWGRFSSGDGATTFRLPDLRGEFIRGLDDSRGIDPARTLGSSQSNSTQDHQHRAAVGFDGGAFYGHVDAFDTPIYGSEVILGNRIAQEVAGVTTNFLRNSYTSGAFNSSGETRPRNIALLVCIKY